MSLPEHERGMPVGDKVGWSNERFPMALFPDRRCEANHGQSSRRLAERGGLGWCEAAAIVEDRKWRKMDAAEAEKIVRTYANELASGILLLRGVSRRDERSLTLCFNRRPTDDELRGIHDRLKP